MAEYDDPASLEAGANPAAQPSAKEPLDDDSFREQVRTLIQSARDHMDHDILPAVERATRYLNGGVDASPANALPQDDGTAVYEGSRVVIRECSDRFRMMMPEIARVFLSSDEAVAFLPATEEDEPKAEQQTDYVNWLWRVKNHGEDLLLDLVHDWGAKFCALKAYWCSQERTTTTGFDVTPEAFQVLQQQAQVDPDVLTLDAQMYQSVVQAQQPTPDGGVMPAAQPIAMVKGTVTKRETRGHVKIESIPHDEFLIDADTRTSEDALFVGTDQFLTVSDAVALGIGLEAVLEHASSTPASGETGTRFARRGHSDRLQQANRDQSLDWVRVVQGVAQLDRDGDGIAEKYRIIALGEQFELYDAQKADDVVYICGSPYRTPHEPIGKGIVEEMMDIQDVQTSLMRSSLDNYRRSNHAREVIDSKDVDAYRDLTSWYGGPIRSKNPTGFAFHQIPFVGDKAFPYLQYFQGIGSMRTGIDPAGMGIDPDVLKGMTADASKMVTTAPQSRMEYLIREFAVQVQRPLFRACLQLSVRYQDKPATVRLRNKWVEVDPSSWSAEMDCTVRVGLGTGTRQERLIGLLAILAKQEQLLATGSPLVTLAEYRNSLQELAELNGHKDVARYFKEMDEQQLAAAQQQQQQAQQAQMQAAIEMEAAKARAVAEVKAQADLQKAQLDAEVQRQKIGSDQDTAQQSEIMRMAAERDRLAFEREKAREDAVMNLTIQREKIAMDREVALATIESNARMKMAELAEEKEIERMKMKNRSPGGNGNLPEVVKQ